MARGAQRPPKRSVTLHVRVDEELAMQVQDLALAEDRTVSYFIARILRQYVAEQRGHVQAHSVTVPGRKRLSHKD
jgi:hypothetical protein